MLRADVQQCYHLDLLELLQTPGNLGFVVSLLTYLPEQAVFHKIDHSKVLPRQVGSTSRNRPLNPGEYTPIEQVAAKWVSSVE